MTRRLYHETIVKGASTLTIESMGLDEKDATATVVDSGVHFTKTNEAQEEHKSKDSDKQQIKIVKSASEKKLHSNPRKILKEGEGSKRKNGNLNRSIVGNVSEGKIETPTAMASKRKGRLFDWQNRLGKKESK